MTAIQSLWQKTNRFIYKQLLSCKMADMLHKKLHPFIQCVLQNGGSLSTGKKEGLFAELKPDELHQMERIIYLYMQTSH